MKAACALAQVNKNLIEQATVSDKERHKLTERILRKYEVPKKLEFIMDSMALTLKASHEIVVG